MVVAQQVHALRARADSVRVDSLLGLLAEDLVREAHVSAEEAALDGKALRVSEIPLACVGAALEQQRHTVERVRTCSMVKGREAQVTACIAFVDVRSSVE